MMIAVQNVDPMAWSRAVQDLALSKAGWMVWSLIAGWIVIRGIYRIAQLKRGKVD